MPDREHDLISMIARFREAIADLLVDNTRFHEDLNGAEPISFAGLGSPPSEYSIESHEALIWRDPEAYMDEYSRWKEYSELETHQQVIDHLRNTDQEQVFRGLVQAVRKGRVCPFVGAGCSAALKKPHRVPGWKEALLDLVSKIQHGAGPDVAAKCVSARTEIARGNVVEAGAILYGAAKAQVDNYVGTKLAVSRDIRLGEISGPVLLLPELTDGCVITTNFDDLIEKVFQHAGRPFEGYMHGTQKHHKFATSLAHGERCILKLHGDASDTDTYIFSTQQYDSAYGSPIDFSKPLSRSLRQVYVSNTILFLGCNLETDRPMQLFEAVAASDEFVIPNHYAILEDTGDPALTQEKETRLLQMKIKPIWFPSGEYELVEQILSACIAAAKKRITI